MKTVLRFLIATWFCIVSAGNNIHAAPPRVLPEGTLPDDVRLGDLTHVNSYFPFTPPATKEDWERRAERLRRQILVSQGLWPQPTKTPLNATIYGSVERDDYTVERVHFESVPGHFVTGSLYRPKTINGKNASKLPGVLFAHGHWNDGRFHDDGTKAARQQIADGAERFENGARFMLQAPCVQLARMGCVVFALDMEGYADSVQLLHRPGVRPEMNSPDGWGFFSPRAESRLQTFMGLQTLNAIRVLDWFSELPDVDPKRIGVTGASGGGTQTFVLCAIDPRPAVAFPAVMVGTAMQGGCTCENSAYLRVGTGNVEIAALIAPRPLGMTGANDWTKDLETKGLPELKKIYTLMGAKDSVMAKVFPHFPHNYNYVAREVMYHWMNKHLKLGLAEPILEEDFKPLSREELTVWDVEPNGKHPKPESGPKHEIGLLRWLAEDSEKQLAALTPKDAESLKEYRRVVGGGWNILVGRESPYEDTRHDPARPEKQERYHLTKVRLTNKAKGTDRPLIVLDPLDYPNKHHVTVVWLDGAGKAGLFDAEGKHPIPAVQLLLDSGLTVVGIDLLYQGEYLADGKPLTEARMVDPKDAYKSTAACYTYGYNNSLFAERVHDAQTAIAFALNLDMRNMPVPVSVVGVNGAGPIALAAAADSHGLGGYHDIVGAVAVDTAGFRFANVTKTNDLNFVPGAVKYGDIPSLISLCTQRRLWLSGEGEKLPDIAAATFQATGRKVEVKLYTGPADEQFKSIAEWIAGDWLTK